MPLLDAALAFAMTMLVVATAVTAIMRVVKTTFNRIRQKKLEELLKEFYTKELEPTVRTEVVSLGDKVGTEAAKSLVARANELQERFKGDGKGQLIKELGFDEATAKEMLSLSSTELIERLRRSEIGQHLLTDLKGDAEPVFQKLEARYQVLGEKVAEIYRTYSRWASTITAMVLAFCVNIDSLHLISTYMTQDEVRAAVVGQFEVITSQYETAPDGQAPEVSGDIADAREAIEEQIAALEASGFPIGWPRFPRCGPAPDNRCMTVAKAFGVKENELEITQVAKTGQFWTWVLGCLLTGILAGLGAPFWWDVISGIAKSAQAYSGAKAPAVPSAAPQMADAGTGTPAEEAQ